MKYFFMSMMAVLMFSIATVPVAEAKRFGGGKSFGKSFKTAPAPKQNMQNTQSLNKKPQANNSRRNGLLGGLFGGLLAGGLLAAFFGGAFEGIQFMDILIIGLLAYLAFRIFKGMKGVQSTPSQSAYQGANMGSNYQRQSPQNSNIQNFEQPQSNSQGGFGSTGKSDVPYNFAPDFDAKAFVEGSREHYRTLQGAWNYNQLETIEEYVSPALFSQLKQERASLEGEQHTDVMYVDAEIVRADYSIAKAELSLQFTGRYRDKVEAVEEDIDEIWHLERDLTQDNQPWLIVGIQTNS